MQAVSTSAAAIAGWHRQRDRLAASIWRAHEERVPLVMGIVNVTPDSFSDGGQHDSPGSAIAHARRLADEGAALLDIGGESTRPGAPFIAAEEEAGRVLPVLQALGGEETPLSIDTYKADVARQALAAGAVMVNDVWAMQRDPDMAPLLAETGALAVLMHNRAEIDPALDLRDGFRRWFDTVLAHAGRAGIERGRIVLDPGIGFGKTDAQNLESIRLIPMLRETYGLPVLLGLSRKSLFGRLLGRAVDARLAATLAADLYGARAGAALLRVHDVAAHRDALAVTTLLACPSSGHLPAGRASS
ncbi:dihydropteroate synthase [Swaminathania salitolerans]|uniref:Dihydropteroate synthase n=1 Tax=Swaminathania salitolerans TaxID=182838 RepID=A0A511BR12_9PROT|nr:dihydropteroate synthase [Swaminathania salitolerans]GBQ11540.1 dihydropteroate synthase [Swaminathania salitolerans LMG 21291]GEL02522.1 dihydropteroate synthase [Swaminathania salitolerans]